MSTCDFTHQQRCGGDSLGISEGVGVDPVFTLNVDLPRVAFESNREGLRIFQQLSCSLSGTQASC